MEWLKKTISIIMFWNSPKRTRSKKRRNQSYSITDKKERKMVENLPFEELAEYLFEKGSKVIEKELKKGVKAVMELDKSEKYNLKPTDLLSGSVVLNKDLPSKVKSRILEVKKNINAFVHGIALEIEENHFKTAEELVDNSEWMTEQKNKVWGIIQGQKEINYSFRTIEVTIEVFRRYNNRILEEIKLVSDDEKNFKLRIENALLAYELLDFTYTQIQKFTLTGVDELNNVKQQIFDDIREGELETEELKKKLSNTSEKAKNTMMKRIEQRKFIWQQTKKKWGEIDQKVESVIEEIRDVKKILPDLDAFRLDAKIHLRAISVALITRIVEDSLEVLQEFADFDKNLLAPFGPDDYLKLIGEQSKK